MGRPAVFIRLSGCVPPFCPWCDTAYAQGPGERIGVEEILEKIGTYDNDFAVITGGEPFLQWNAGLRSLESGLFVRGYSIQYETSGKAEIPENSKGFKVCSPKFLDGKWRFVSKNAARVDAFKFVASDDFDGIAAFAEKFEIPNEKIWIMPLGATRKEQLDRSRKIWNFCVENSYNFSPRLHILAFDRRKGI